MRAVAGRGASYLALLLHYRLSGPKCWAATKAELRAARRIECALARNGLYWPAGRLFAAPGAPSTKLHIKP